MKRENIICLAREAGISNYGLTGWTCWSGQLERFADLVAAAEREECAKMIETTDLGGLSADPKFQNWIAFLLFNYAAAIRARGKS